MAKHQAAKQRTPSAGACPHQDVGQCQMCAGKRILADVYQRRLDQLLELPTARFTRLRQLRTVLAFSVEIFWSGRNADTIERCIEFDNVYTAMIERDRQIPIP